MEVEDEVSKEEDEEGDSAEDDELVSPSHVARDRTACCARCDSWSMT